MNDNIFIPASRKAAKRELQSALAKAKRLEDLPKADFMRAYCSVAYLFPGFHPDDWEDWTGPAKIKPLLAEVWRLAEAGDLADNELYPYQAAKTAISKDGTKASDQVETDADDKKR